MPIDSYTCGISAAGRISLHNWNDSLKGVLLGALTGVGVGLGGFILAEIPTTHAMGGVVFLLVPFAAGVAITAVSHDVERISAAALLATVGSLAILIAMKMETPVCALMAFPLLFVGLLIGVGLGSAIGYSFRKLRGRFGGSDATFTSIILLAMPLLIFAGHRLEVSNPIQARRQTSQCHLSPPDAEMALRSLNISRLLEPLDNSRKAAASSICPILCLCKIHRTVCCCTSRRRCFWMPPSRQRCT